MPNQTTDQKEQRWRDIVRICDVFKMKLQTIKHFLEAAQ
jgi:hypothetical protein